MMIQKYIIIKLKCHKWEYNNIVFFLNVKSVGQITTKTKMVWSILSWPIYLDGIEYGQVKTSIFRSKNKEIHYVITCGKFENIVMNINVKIVSWKLNYNNNLY